MDTFRFLPVQNRKALTLVLSLAYMLNHTTAEASQRPKFTLDPMQIPGDRFSHFPVRILFVTALNVMTGNGLG
jgi:hypothetical protein